MIVRSALAIASMVLIGTLVGCSSADEDGATNVAGSASGQAVGAAPCVARPKVPVADLASPITSFEADVAPILVSNCSFSPCHASHGSSNHGVFLSAKSSDDLAAVKASLRGKSQELNAMPYVSPGDPDNSFVMHKLDGDQCTLDPRCSGQTCGQSMPQNNALLPEATRDVVRRWIAQGAK